MPAGGHRLWVVAHTKSQELAPFGLSSGWEWPRAPAQHVSLGSSRKGAGGWEQRFALDSGLSGEDSVLATGV